MRAVVAQRRARLVRALLGLVAQLAPRGRYSPKSLREHLPAVVEAQRRARLVRALLGLVAQLALPDQCSQISLRARMRAVVAPCLRAEMQCVTTNWVQAAPLLSLRLASVLQPLARRLSRRFRQRERARSRPVGRPSQLLIGRPTCAHACPVLEIDQICILILITGP